MDYTKKVPPQQVCLNLQVTDITENNQGVAKDNQQVFFIENALPGDIVDVEVTKQKKGYTLAKVIHLQKPSKDREKPFCTHFTVCGGCQRQHINYAAQLKIKQTHVRNQLLHLAKINEPNVLPIIPAKETKYYRNKLEYTFSSTRWLTKEEIDSTVALDRAGLGFHKPPYFDKVVDIQHCYLQAEPSNSIKNTVRELSKTFNMSYYNFKTHQGLLRNLIIRTSSLGDVMVIVQFGYDDPEAIAQMMEAIAIEFPNVTSLQYVINQKYNETFHDLPVYCYQGETFITEQIDDLKWRIGPKSFFQTNTQQAAILYRKIAELANLQGNEMVYDLYTGIGTIAHFLAKNAQHVIGIEMVEDAVKDAIMNAKTNQINNVTFYAGDIKDTLQKLSTNTKQPALIVTDPPRAGMHPTVINTLLEIAPAQIIYVSCNPSTQARDLALLQEKYTLQLAQPIDMFPQTKHVENIALLVKK